MVHGDDDGLRIPPKIAPAHVVILPVIPKPEFEKEVTEECEKIACLLQNQQYLLKKYELCFLFRDNNAFSNFPIVL